MLKGPNDGPVSTKMADFDPKGPFRGPVSTLDGYPEQINSPHRGFLRSGSNNSDRSGFPPVRQQEKPTVRVSSGPAAHPPGYVEGPAALPAQENPFRMRGIFCRTMGV